MRRTMWATLRLENEHLNNVEEIWVTVRVTVRGCVRGRGRGRGRVGLGGVCTMSNSVDATLGVLHGRERACMREGACKYVKKRKHFM